MKEEIIYFFDRTPDAIPLYTALEKQILCEWPDVRVEVKKTQISFFSLVGFAYVWLPWRRAKERPGLHIVVSFCLSQRVESERILEVVETYPGRWMHHVIVQTVEEIDGELMRWVREAYDYSIARGIRRGIPRSKDK